MGKGRRNLKKTNFFFPETMKQCHDCGKPHKRGLRCLSCSLRYSNKHRKRAIYIPKPLKTCPDCGKPHKKGERCTSCSLKKSCNDFHDKNPQYSFKYFKKRYYICHHCTRLFLSRRSVKTIKCPFCCKWQDASDTRSIILRRNEKARFDEQPH